MRLVEERLRVEQTSALQRVAVKSIARYTSPVVMAGFPVVKIGARPQRI